MKNKIFIIITLFFIVSTIWPQVVPALPADPQVTALINSLEPNQGAFLDSFDVIEGPDGQGGIAAWPAFETKGPFIRNYCCTWVYADSRQRALYAGGNHAVPHKFNDVWEYDLASNTWVILHAPDPGIETIHAWGFTYNQKLEELYWAHPDGEYVSNWPYPSGYTDPGVRIYRPYQQNGWQMRPRPSSLYPRCHFLSKLTYIPSRDITIHVSNATDGNAEGLWQIDANTNTWTQVATAAQLKADPGCLSRLQASFANYDPQEDAIIYGIENNICRYDLSNGKWSHVKTGNFTSWINKASGTYLDNPGVHLFWDKNNTQFVAYDARSNTLSYPKPKGLSEFISLGDLKMIFYHKALDVVVAYTHKNPRIWVYKYDTATVGTETAIKSECRIAVNMAPMPANAGTRLFADLKLNKKGMVNISLLNINGQKIKSMFSGSINAANNRISLHMIDKTGRPLPSGIYLIRFEVNRQQTLIKRIIIY
jgi:hypothetical protein